MADTKPSDKIAFETLIRSGRRQNRIDWTPTGDQADTDALNAAIRQASGRVAPESGSEPHPWKSLRDADKRDSGDA